MTNLFRQVINIKKESKNRLLSMLQSIVGIVSYFLVMRFVVKFLGLESVGLWSLTIGVLAFFRLLDLSGSLALTRMVAIRMNDSDEQAKCVDTVSLFGLLLFSFLCLVFYFPLNNFLISSIQSELMPLGQKLFLIAIISLPINILSMAQLGALDGLGRADVRSLINIFCYLIFIFFGFYLIPFYGLVGLAYAQLAQYILSLVLARITLSRYIKNLRLLPIYWSSYILKDSIGYVAKIQATSAPMMMLDPLMRVLISRMYGLEFLGLYDLGYKMSVYTRALIQSYLNPTLPELTKVWLKSKNLAFEATVNLHKKYNNIIFACFSALILLSPLSSILLLGVINKEFIFIQSIIGLGWGIATLFLPTNILAKASNNLYYSIAGQILILLVSFIGFYICLPLDNPLTIPLSIIFGIISGSLLGFFGETLSIRKKLTKSYSNKYIVSLAKTSLLTIVLTCSILIFVNVIL
jgi:O-antigen/teichoic acid export membrane protein